MDLEGEWLSKRELPYAVAHFVLKESGRAYCTHLPTKNGTMVTPFTCAWIPLRPENHLCRYCRKVAPRQCTCGVCSIRCNTPRQPLIQVGDL